MPWMRVSCECGGGLRAGERLTLIARGQKCFQSNRWPRRSQSIAGVKGKEQRRNSAIKV